MRPYEKADLDKLAKKIVDQLVREFEWNGRPMLEEVCLFLSSPEVEELVKQIFVLHAKPDDKLHFENIEDEFIILFDNFFGSTKLVENEVRKLFDLLKRIAVGVLEQSVESGSLFAFELIDNFKHNQITDYLKVIDKNLRFLTENTNLNVTKIHEFEARFREQVAQRSRFITPPDFDRSRRIEIDKLYVIPSFVPSSTRQVKHEYSSVLELDDIDATESPFGVRSLLRGLRRYVLLGDPGAGKTTFTTKLCYSISTKRESRFVSNRLVTPILVTLREYSKFKEAKDLSLIEYINTISNSSFQLAPPKHAFEYLLLNGRAMVIFDGLDELLKTFQRKSIVQEIESFSNLYPTVPVLVTSRRVGYDQAPLDRNSFEIFSIAPFNDGQIRKYASKWFSLETYLSEADRSAKVESFLKESAVAEDLRSNPLLLSLMCNLYRGRGHIPNNRPELYEKCSVMLFERWDKDRGIEVPFERHLRVAMMTIAHWIFSNQDLQAGVREKPLIQKAADYLEPYHETRVDAEAVATEFVEYCRGRAWVFTDVGDGIYQFTHRTFMEYFTAYHLTRVHNTPQDLSGLLIARVRKGEWDMVAQLSFQIKEQNSAGAVDLAVKEFLAQCKKSNVKSRDRINILSFLIRLLSFTVPNYSLRCKLIDFVLQDVFDAIDSYPPGTPGIKRIEYRIELIRDLRRANNENKAVVFGQLGTSFKQIEIKTRTAENKSLAKHWLGFAIASARILFDESEIKSDYDVFGNFGQLQTDGWKFEKQIDAAIHCFELGIVSPDELLREFGLRVLFAKRFFWSESVFAWPSLSTHIFRYVSGERVPTIYVDLIESISRFALFVVDNDKIEVPYIEGYSREWMRELTEFKSTVKLDKSQVFGIFVALAVLMEIDSESCSRWILGKRKRDEVSNFTLINCLLARFRKVDERKLEDELLNPNLKPSQRRFIRQWMATEFNLVD